MMPIPYNLDAISQLCTTTLADWIGQDITIREDRNEPFASATITDMISNGMVVQFRGHRAFISWVDCVIEDSPISFEGDFADSLAAIRQQLASTPEIFSA